MPLRLFLGRLGGLRSHEVLRGIPPILGVIVIEQRSWTSRTTWVINYWGQPTHKLRHGGGGATQRKKSRTGAVVSTQGTCCLNTEDMLSQLCGKEKTRLIGGGHGAVVSMRGRTTFSGLAHGTTKVFASFSQGDEHLPC